MRTVRGVTLAVSLLAGAVFTSQATAAPKNGQGNNALRTISSVIVRILDELAIKIGLPPG